MSQPLDPLTFPLHGSRLIEASAGTGKTWTLALLYLRLVLGHGGPAAAFGRSLMPPEILVVTFTNAATEELRGRIRARLVAAAHWLRAAAPSADPLLEQLSAGLAPQQRAAWAWRLERAAEWMDESAISTIHGWCQRMLHEHAFDSGHDFDQALESNQSKLMRMVVEDYWRTFLLPLDCEALAEARNCWKTPDDLLKALQVLLPLAERMEALPGAGQSPAERFVAVLDERKRLMADWRKKGYLESLRTLFEQAAKGKAFNGNRLRSNSRTKVYQCLAAWLADDAPCLPDLPSGKAPSYMAASGVADIWKDRAAAPTGHPACIAFGELIALTGRRREACDRLLRHALDWVGERYDRERVRRATMNYHDLLAWLDAALQSPRGPALAETIRRQFPVALIDEFQDTDPLQYRIFDTIYRVRESMPETGLFMIGDPKQAIYAFRGADIYTYLSARAATEGRHYSLGTNYRSTPELIAAVNALFKGAESRPGGAFGFAAADHNPVPFLPAQAPANAIAQRLRIAGKPAMPLSAWLLDDAETMGVYRSESAAQAAREIARLLIHDRTGRTELYDMRAERWRALAPGDIAVLVNTGDEANLVREALRGYGIHSVYLSERGSVFAAPVAKELQVLLRAIAQPLDERLLGQAHALPLLGRSLDALDRLGHDELFREREGERLRDYHALWQRQGVLPLLYRVLADFAIPARLLDTPGGERELTDLLHLGELLQEASRALEGTGALLRHFDEIIADPGDGEERQLRLESDTGLVKVVTIHKSKGLQYPLVFLPFVATAKPIETGAALFRVHDPETFELGVYRPTGDAAHDADLAARADRERLGEDIRKLYVGLTRGEAAVWIGLAENNQFADSALGHLLGGGALADGLSKLGCCKLLEPDDADQDLRCGVTGQAILQPARSAPELRLESWWIASFSALTADLPDPLPANETPAQETAREDGAHAADLPELSSAPAAGTLHALPRGSQIGTFLHGLFEWAGAQRAVPPNGGVLHGFAAALVLPEARREMLARRCNLRGLTGWIDPLDAWLVELLQRRWSATEGAVDAASADGFALCGLDARCCQVELEFWFASAGVASADLDALLCRYIQPGRPRPPLAPRQVRGMVKGFIDLVFEHAGRYYLIDWKSNWLGPDDAAYAPEALATEVLHARYDLQYALYLLALHRQLRVRLPDYDYERHIGGAWYVFLRGLNGAARGRYADRPPFALIDGLDALFRAQSQREGA